MLLERRAFVGAGVNRPLRGNIRRIQCNNRKPSVVERQGIISRTLLLLLSSKMRALGTEYPTQLFCLLSHFLPKKSETPSNVMCVDISSSVVRKNKRFWLMIIIMVVPERRRRRGKKERRKKEEQTCGVTSKPFSVGSEFHQNADRMTLQRRHHHL